METYFDYLRVMAPMLGERIVQTYPALQSPKDRPAAQLKTLLRKPLPAQALAITGLAKYLKTARSTRIVAECGAGKTFMSLGTMHVHGGHKPYTAHRHVPASHRAQVGTRGAVDRPSCTRLHR